MKGGFTHKLRLGKPPFCRFEMSIPVEKYFAPALEEALLFIQNAALDISESLGGVGFAGDDPEV